MDYSSIEKFDVRDTHVHDLVDTVNKELNSYFVENKLRNGAIKHLSELLHDLTQGENPPAKSHPTYLVLFAAIPGRKNCGDYWNGKFLDDIFVETNSLSEDLRNFQNLSEDRQKELVSFCDNLRKELSIYHDICYS
ncbi:MAG: hypothetical protein Q8P15_03250 [Nanoarchaeota archaeon]|nr:hypothetical protein [Nanoarchaeota archaeon]